MENKSGKIISIRLSPDVYQSYLKLKEHDKYLSHKEVYEKGLEHFLKYNEDSER